MQCKSGGIATGYYCNITPMGELLGFLPSWFLRLGKEVNRLPLYPILFRIAPPHNLHSV